MAKQPYLGQEQKYCYSPHTLAVTTKQSDIIIIYFEIVPFFHAKLWIDVSPISSPSTYLWILPIQAAECRPSNFMSSFTHSPQVFLALLTDFTPATSISLQDNTKSSSHLRSRCLNHLNQPCLSTSATKWIPTTTNPKHPFCKHHKDGFLNPQPDTLTWHFVTSVFPLFTTTMTIILAIFWFSYTVTVSPCRTLQNVIHTQKCES